MYYFSLFIQEQVLLYTPSFWSLNILDITGNFHPLLVHLPIGIFILGFSLEIFSRLKKKQIPGFISEFILLIAAAFSMAAIVSGWVLSEGGGYETEAINLHRNMGIAFTIGALILYYVFKAKNPSLKKAYMPFYSLLVILLSITGHYGGNLTHGEGFLLGQTSSEITRIDIEDMSQAMVYEDLVQPILEAKCVSCHNSGKTKGELLMTSRDVLLKGGKHGSIFPTDQDSLGTLITRIHLDSEDKLHMPPRSKAQLNQNEIALLDWWIKNENCFDCQVADLPSDPKTENMLAAFAPKESLLLDWANEFEAVPEDYIISLKAHGINVYPVAADNPMLIVNVKGKKDLSRSDFKRLKKYATQIVELNLSRSNMNDTLAVFLSDFDHLLKLQLAETPITDKSLDPITELKHLVSLNAFNTQLSALALEKVSAMESLQTAYFTGTQIPLNDLAQFNAQSESTRMEFVGPETFAQTSLDPPKIISETDFFKSELEVSLAYIFDDADLYYTIDGSIPDTLSTRYTQPFTLKASSQVRAITHMKGWGMSEIAQADFKKSSLDYEAVSLLATPNEKYAAQGGASLVDLKRGSTNFVDGMWLGFEGVHTGAEIRLKKTEKIKSVSVGALSAPASWIFFPAAIEVYSSENGSDYTLIGKKTFKPIEPTNDISKKFFDISLPETQTKLIKLVIKSPLTNPVWHPNPGEKSWVFIDEVILD